MGGARPRDPKGAGLNLTYLWKVLSVLEGSVSEWACLRHRAGIKGEVGGFLPFSEETVATGGSLHFSSVRMTTCLATCSLPFLLNCLPCSS